MKILGVGITIVLIVVVGVFVVKDGDNSVAEALSASEPSINSELSEGKNLTSEQFDKLELMATSSSQGTAVLKSADGDIWLLREKDFFANGAYAVERISDGALMLRELATGDLSVIYAESHTKPTLRISSTADIESVGSVYSSK